MNFLYFLFSVIFVFCLPMYFVHKDKNKKAAYFCALAVALLFVLNVDKIQVIKLGLLEAELKETIQEGQATLEQLKKISLVMAERNYTDIALANKLLTPTPIGKLLESKKSLDSALNDLGATKEEINKASESLKVILGRQMIFMIFKDKDYFSDGERTLWVNFLQPYWSTDQNVPPLALNNFLIENGLYNEPRMSRFNEYKIFYESLEIVNPDVFKPSPLISVKNFESFKAADKKD